MKKVVHHFVPITLQGLTKKLDFEAKRLVREKEDGVVRHVRTKATLHGISILVFKNKEGKNITFSYRHDEGGTLRFAREEQFAQK
jgi:hypothetical protein